MTSQAEQLVKPKNHAGWRWVEDLPKVRPHYQSETADVQIFPPDGKFYTSWYVMAFDFEREFKDEASAFYNAKRVCEGRY